MSGHRVYHELLMWNWELEEIKRQSLIMQFTTALCERLGQSQLLVCPILNETVLTLYFVYYVSWHCTVSFDDCLFGGSILSKGGELLFLLHYPIRDVGLEDITRQSLIMQFTTAL